MVLKAVDSSASFIAVLHSSENQENITICWEALKEESIGTKPGYCTKAWKPALFSNIAIFWTVPKAEKTCIIPSPLCLSTEAFECSTTNCFSQIYQYGIQTIGELITSETLAHWSTLQEQVQKSIQYVKHRWSQHTAYSQLTPATHYSLVLFSFHQVQCQTVTDIKK